MRRLTTVNAQVLRLSERFLIVACTLKEEVIYIIHSLITFANFRIRYLLMCPQGCVIQQEHCVTDGDASVLWKDDLAGQWPLKVPYFIGRSGTYGPILTLLPSTLLSLV